MLTSSTQPPSIRALRYSKASLARMKAMEASLDYLDKNSIEGDVVECGVWAGGHTILSRLVSPERVNWMYDTFDGMTEPTKHDVRRDGGKALDIYNAKERDGRKMSAVSLDDVLNNLKRENVFDDAKIRIVAGDVLETLRYEKNMPEKIALLRLDTDWYRSTAFEMRQLYPRLQSGGILIVDDYNHWMGARKAVNEYLCAADRERLKPIDYTAVMLLKP